MSPPGLSAGQQGAIVLACMTVSCSIGFWLQSKMIHKYYESGEAQIHHRAKEIHRLEMLELRWQAEEEERRKLKEQQQRPSGQ